MLVPRPPTFIEAEEPETGIAQPLALSKNKTGTDVNYLEPNEFIIGPTTTDFFSMILYPNIYDLTAYFARVSQSGQ